MPEKRTVEDGKDVTYSITPEDRSEQESGLAQANSQEQARKAITAKDASDTDMPRPPNTAGMGLVQASEANKEYQRRLAAYRERPLKKPASPSPSPSPSAQAKALREGGQ